jgi:hypothetical protein
MRGARMTAGTAAPIVVNLILPVHATAGPAAIRVACHALIGGALEDVSPGEHGIDRGVHLRRPLRIAFERSHGPGELAAIDRAIKSAVQASGNGAVSVGHAVHQRFAHVGGITFQRRERSQFLSRPGVFQFLRKPRALRFEVITTAQASGVRIRIAARGLRAEFSAAASLLPGVRIERRIVLAPEVAAARTAAFIGIAGWLISALGVEIRIRFAVKLIDEPLRQTGAAERLKPFVNGLCVLPVTPGVSRSCGHPRQQGGACLARSPFEPSALLAREIRRSPVFPSWRPRKPAFRWTIPRFRDNSQKSGTPVDLRWHLCEIGLLRITQGAALPIIPEVQDRL